MTASGPPAPDARSSADTAPAVPSEAVDWRRVHKITPVLNAWKVIVAVLAVLVYQNVEMVGELWAERDSVDWATVGLIGLGVVVLLLAILAVYATLSWRMMRYAVGDDAVFLHSGILFRQQRHARLNRIQAIDVVQPLLARIFGLAQLKIETAGGTGSSVILAFLQEEEAHRLRAELLARGKTAAPARAAGPSGAGQPVPTGPPGSEGAVAYPAAAQHGAGSSGGPAEAMGGPAGAVRAPAPDAPERELLSVPATRLVGSLLLSGSTIAFVLVLAALVVVAIVARSVAPLAGSLPGVLGWGAYLWGRFSGGFAFRASISEDGVRLRHGLLEQRSQTVPPGRVHAVRLSQPLLWRRKGWWRVDVNIAGYGAEEAAKGGSVLLPVGSRGEALTALWLVLPDLGVADARAVLDAALEGDGDAAGFLTSPRRARWLDPITWRRNGLLITSRAMLMRAGRLHRTLTIVPHERTQSLSIEQGPWERRLDLANFAVASVPGGISPRVHHLDAMTALAVLDDQAERARTARHGESPEEWLRRVGVANASAEEPQRLG
ncbi:PH domain-containing protein [Georgenia sp. MJ206]|uniref:PH domain-containing protein n=1 Tax=Georgenia wangjunii TaxID=3117730 RepID=UPI002F26C721